MEKRDDFFVKIAKILPARESWDHGRGVGKRVINRFVRLIRERVDDPRQQGKLEYPLSEIIVLAFFAVLAGATTFSDIATCCAYKKKFFKKFLRLENGIPSHDTFNRVFSLIDMEQLEEALVLFVSQAFEQLRKALKIPPPKMKQICVDGKVSRGSGRYAETAREIRDIQTLNVYCTEDGICLHSRQIGKKTNEIPMAQAILSTMDLRHTIISFDAMNTQIETVRTIVNRKGEYLGGLKRNHKTLYEECVVCFDDAYLEKVKDDGELSHYYMEKAHNQIEHMKFTVMRISTQQGSHFAAWPKLRSVVRYERKTENLISGKKSCEVRYYITSLIGKAEVLARAIRTHWQIESFHWLLDVVFYDDANTTVDRRANGNITLIKKMVLSLYRMMKPLENAKTISSIRRLYQWGYEDGIRRLLASCDAAAIENSLKSYKNKH